MKQFLLLVFGLVIVQLGYGQQRPQYSMYMQNNYLLNPALSGVEDYIDVRSGYRKQWLGITNAPSTFYVSAHMAINKNDRNARRSAAAPRKTNTFKIEPQANRNSRMYKARPHHGVGLIVQSDQTGPLSTTTFNGTYAYHIPLTARIKLSSGATLGMVQHSFNPYQATVTNQNDPALMDGRTNTVNVDLGLGGWLYSDQFFVGVAAQQLIPNQDDYSNTGYTEGDGPLQRHVYITGGYKFSVSKYLDIVPSTMVKIASPSPVAVDVNLKAIYARRLWAGVSYRHNDAIATMIGLNVSPLLDVAYSYDATTSTIRKVSAGSHEVMVGLKLVNRRGIMCPQWMW